MDDQPPETLLCSEETWPYIVGTPRHTRLLAWLQANDIEPKDVAIDDLKVVHAAGGPVIDFYVHLRNSAGNKYIDPDGSGHPAMEHRTVPCAIPPPRARRADITTKALLQCIADRRALRSAVPFMDSLQIPRAWDLLCTVYPEKVVAAAFFRENDRGLLDYGINVSHSFLTPEGEARLLELGGTL